MRIGYACINTTLGKNDVMVNRSMVKRTFVSKGVGYASELALKNVMDLEKVIDWNTRSKVQFYRMSSDMFPWMSEYELNQLPDIMAIRDVLSRIGSKVMTANARLTFHPGPFNVLATSNPVVLKNTLKELRQHGEIMDMLYLPRSPFAKINIHIGGAYGDRPAALKRFCQNFRLLESNVASRLTVENDDKINMFSVSDLQFVSREIGVPVVFDYLHHKLCTGGLSEEQAFHKAFATWTEGITPVVHYSSQKKIFEDKSAKEAAHADFIYEPISTYGKDVDVMLEAKAKDVAVKKFTRKFGRQLKGS